MEAVNASVGAGRVNAGLTAFFADAKFGIQFSRGFWLSRLEVVFWGRSWL